MLDNQANISIINEDLLSNIRDADEEVKINGLGGHQFTVSKTGYLDPLFGVHASEETQANILSLSEVEDKYLVTYVPQEKFIIHLLEMDIEFNLKAGMYVADWRDIKMAYASSISSVYTKAKEARAKQAYEIRTSGFPSANEAIHLIQDRNITGMPAITIEDLRRAYKIYGTPPEFVRGRMTKKKVSRAVIDNAIVMEEKRQASSSDVMHIDGQINE